MPRDEYGYEMWLADQEDRELALERHVANTEAEYLAERALVAQMFAALDKIYAAAAPRKEAA